MANLSVVLSANITVADSTQSPAPTIISRAINTTTQPTTLAATVDFANNFFQCTGATTVNLPAATVWVVYVKNLDVAANLTVTYTPAGGASSTALLVPGGVFLYFQPSEGAGGITALTLTPSAGTTAADVYVSK